MTIKELKEKIAGLNAELDRKTAGRPFTGRHPSHTALELIELQAKLIKALEVTTDCKNSVDHVHLSGAWDLGV